MEFTEVMRQFHRMCMSEDCLERTTCPLMQKSSDSCRKYAYENSCDFENIVMTWAAEHPEPVYPTWGEWLKSNIQSTTVLRGFPDLDNVYDILLHSTIPADIAEKLGIKPKEG